MKGLTIFLVIVAIATGADAQEQRKLLSKRNLGGACPSGSDINGWRCSGDSSVYCSCNTYREPYSCERCKYETKYSNGKYKSKYKCRWTTCYRNRWECHESQRETCEYGTPKCQYGRCKEAVYACGNDWNPFFYNGFKCNDVYTYPEDIQECKSVFGNQEICPLNVVNYKTWANKMENAGKILSMMKQAASDTIWWTNKFRSMYELNVNITNNITGEYPFDQLEDIVKDNFEVFRKFSCLRNIPKCEMDKPSNVQCETACLAINPVVSRWLETCDATKEINNHECSGLGYFRDCLNTQQGENNPWPGLCVAYQNELPSPPTPDPHRSSGTRNKVGFSFLFLYLLHLIK